MDWLDDRVEVLTYTHDHVLVADLFSEYLSSYVGAWPRLMVTTLGGSVGDNRFKLSDVDKARAKLMRELQRRQCGVD